VFESGGLGSSLQDWEEVHGPGTEYPPGFEYEDAKYYVIYAGENIWNIEVDWWAVGDGVSLDDARQECEQLIPVDSQFIEAYSPGDSPELIVDLYVSASLISRFDSQGDWWIGGEPGNFIVVHDMEGGVVVYTILDTGNSP
jgi:hypothetical protein